MFGTDALLRIVIASVVMILTEVVTVMIRHRPSPRVEGFQARMLERLKQIRP